jgi:predicted nucleotidyltransferase
VLRTETGKPIRIPKSSISSHEKPIPFFGACSNSSTPFIKRILRLFYDQFYPLSWEKTLKKEVSGNQHHYHLDSSCPVYPEIKSLVLKTVGLCDVLKRALAPAEDHIELACVFGSFAKGDYGNESDVDVLLVSDLPGVELAKLTGPVQNEIGRAVNVSHFSVEEFRRRKQEKDHFVTRILENHRMMIIEKSNDT